VVAAAVVDALSDLNLRFPQVSDAQKSELNRIRLSLEQE